MPEATPFHSRIVDRCDSFRFKEWAGFVSVHSFEKFHDMEYFAIRHACAVLDASALCKYEIAGRDAGRLLARTMVKDMSKLKPGRVGYTAWCDDDGFVLDDGTVTNLGGGRFRVTAAEPSLAWFDDCARGLDVEIRDTTRELGTLALQGPTSRDLLVALGADVRTLRYFGHRRVELAGVDIEVTRTGYTGDLGYELWVKPEDATHVWDALFEMGPKYRLKPMGLDALDVARIEAGYIMNGVDYFSANHCAVERRKSTPFELGLDWLVKLDREPFVGRDALRREKRHGSRWALAGLVYDWDEYERMHYERELPPEVPAGAARDSLPVYDGLGKRQVGYITSRTWSPTTKQMLAMATVEPAYAQLGADLRVEVTLDYERHTVGARVAPLPFFDPPRKRRTPK